MRPHPGSPTVARRIAAGALAATVFAALPSVLHAQEPVSSRPTLDTVVVEVQNVFPPEETAKSGFFRLMNHLHVPTKPWVIRHELLFHAGDPYDSLLAHESERLLRARQLFQEVRIDTVRIDSRLAARVAAHDAWSLRPQIGFTVATDGTWTGKFGMTEANLLGTGNLANAAWVKDLDRQGPRVAADFRNLFGWQVGAAGSVNFWDDGTEGFWRAGDPWSSSVDPRSAMVFGNAANRNVYQYVVESPASTDTTVFKHNANAGRLLFAFAPRRKSEGYLRLGAEIGVRQERYVPSGTDPAVWPDTTYGELRAFTEYSRNRYLRMRYLNGFAEEDVDLGTSVKVDLNMALSGLGYARSGIGPRLNVSTGTGSERAFVVATLNANALFTSAGLDSGRVVAEVTGVLKSKERQNTVLYVTAGAQDHPPPGDQFDLGFETPPRAWGPHSFVGTRMIWGTAEHRWYVLENLSQLVSVGFAAFVDYGGAWYTDQSRRFGGDAGVGLRLAGALSPVARTARIDFACRFGPDSGNGQRCTLTLGAGFAFPWNPPPSSPVPDNPD